ncbi:hypothetical protein M2447_000605 [Ereboglobus sp. PH5-10]|uniref:hypothetical protein n=1 Tax=Ereboglobus sp. PH5-10 TaxID=2940629 RepID=UPI002406BF49|nr:hypothetical protein [Ereboglobus sp. PH5-10]MDF9826524.1 hypothetical protein [Ereboglobus sp. PH5-10]
MPSPSPRPSRLWPDVILAAVALIAGGALACACLVFKPVTIIPGDSSPPQNTREVYYAQGSRDRAKGASWIRKRAALLAAAPGVITLNEDELNTWFAASSRARQARRSGTTAPAPQLDFRIDDNLLQVAAPVIVQTPAGKRTVLMRMRGNFERVAANPDTGLPSVIMYAPREAHAGSLPLHRIPGATAWLISKVLQSQTPPGEALAAWRKIERVTIAGRELRIIISNTNE